MNHSYLNSLIMGLGFILLSILITLGFMIVITYLSSRLEVITP